MNELITRRGLLGSITAGSVVGNVGCATERGYCPESAVGGNLKFCAFADIHYYPKTLPHDSVEWLERILDRADRAGCDMIIHMGDFCHRPWKCKDYVSRYNDFHIPCYHTIGNHDDDGNTHERTLEAYKLKNGYYFFDMKGFRFVVTDTNYYVRDGVFIHYSHCNYLRLSKPDKEEERKVHNISDTRVPPEELEWLRDVIENSPYPVIVTSHAGYDRPYPESAAVRAIFREANERHPGRVRLVINGHHHTDNIKIQDNIIYFDLNSASYQWMMRRTHTAYPESYLERWSAVNHTIMWDDPISAIITISDDGRIKMEGQISRFHLGITPEMAGYSHQYGGVRPTTPNIQSFELTMKY